MCHIFIYFQGRTNTSLKYQNIYSLYVSQRREHYVTLQTPASWYVVQVEPDDTKYLDKLLYYFYYIIKRIII